MRNVNTEALEYAAPPAAGALTRPTGFRRFRHAQIFRIVGASLAEPFGEPARVPSEGFLEGATLAPAGGHFEIWRVARGTYASKMAAP